MPVPPLLGQPVYIWDLMMNDEKEQETVEKKL